MLSAKEDIDEFFECPEVIKACEVRTWWMESLAHRRRVMMAIKNSWVFEASPPE